MSDMLKLTCELGQPVSAPASPLGFTILCSLSWHLCYDFHKLVKLLFLCGKNDSKRKLADVSLDERREGANNRVYGSDSP